MSRLAVVVSHPIQYYAPWFARLAKDPAITLHVFHLWDGGLRPRHDPGFAAPVRWDLPLLEGYPCRFVANASRDPGPHHLGGLHNPSLVAELRGWRPDAVLLFGYAWRSQLAVLLDPRLWGTPILFRGDSHGLVPRRDVKGRLAGLLRRLLFRRFAAALAVGRANAEWLWANGVPPDRIFFAPHAIDLDRFRRQAPRARAEAQAWRHELGIAPEAPVLLFVGKLQHKKRPHDLLEAFARLHHPEAVLVLVGSGPLEPQLRRRAAALPPGRVVFAGFRNQRAMPAAYALADLLVLPSLGAGETWGLCVNEAMAMGVPALVSSHVGCGPDLIRPGRTGWTFPAGDLEALREALARALADRRRLRRMGLLAARHIQGYSYEQASRGLHRALRRLELE